MTIYYGNKLPRRYIGSTSIEKIKSGYRGSVASSEYKLLWEEELKINPQLFKTRILTKHHNREEAIQKELEIQKKYNVKRNNLFINKSFAQPNGFFGRDVSGKNNPMYGTSRKGEKHKGGENISAALKEAYEQTEWGKKKKEESSKLLTENNPASNPATMNKIKETWKKRGRNLGDKNGMFGEISPMKNKKLYNNGFETKAFEEDKHPFGWVKGRHKIVHSKK
jgi:hypothetical protein